MYTGMRKKLSSCRWELRAVHWIFICSNRNPENNWRTPIKWMTYAHQHQQSLYVIISMYVYLTILSVVFIRSQAFETKKNCSTQIISSAIIERKYKKKTEYCIYIKILLIYPAQNYNTTRKKKLLEIFYATHKTQKIIILNEKTTDEKNYQEIQWRQSSLLIFISFFPSPSLFLSLSSDDKKRPSNIGHIWT